MYTPRHLRLHTGFTLIELMIVVAIVGILAAIAYPSYTEQVRQSRRSDCEGALTGLASAMERYFTVNNTYVGAAVGAGGIFPNQCPIDGNTAYYTLQIPSLPQPDLHYKPHVQVRRAAINAAPSP